MRPAGFEPEPEALSQPNRNLSRLNEDVLDLDLVEAAVRHVDEASPDGAMLVFLPGGWVAGTRSKGACRGGAGRWGQEGSVWSP